MALPAAVCVPPSLTLAGTLCTYAQYKGASDTACQDCPGGRYASSTGTTVCTKCPSGSYCLPGATAPTACTRGYYGESELLAVHTCNGPCPAGHTCPEGTSKSDAK